MMRMYILYRYVYVSRDAWVSHKFGLTCAPQPPHEEDELLLLEAHGGDVHRLHWWSAASANRHPRSTVPHLSCEKTARFGMMRRTLNEARTPALPLVTM